MKILVLGDIHSNWPALSAIRESFDLCLFVGDLVDYGTNPIPCIEWVQQNVSAGIRGNHDHAVAQYVPAIEGTGFRNLAAATRPWHWKILSESHLQFLAQLPVTRYLTIKEKTFYLVHGTPRDPLDEYLVQDAAAWTERLEPIEADYVLVGHTHIPMHLDLGRVQVVNPGSVGQPRDGDPRCSYAVIENGTVQIRRVEYDIAATVEHMSNAGLSEEILEFAETILRKGGMVD